MAKTVKKNRHVAVGVTIVLKPGGKPVSPETIAEDMRQWVGDFLWNLQHFKGVKAEIENIYGRLLYESKD